MKKYGKIVCGALRVPQNYPDYIIVNGRRYYKPSEKTLLAAGYLPIEETQPEEREGEVAVAKYAVCKDGTKIVQSWEYVTPEPTNTEAE